MAQFAYSKAGTPVATSTIAAELLARYQDTSTGNIWVATGTSSAAQWVLDFTAETVVPVANGGTNSSAALSGSSIMVSNGTSVVQGAAGTSTTVLHGNASGTPTYSAVSLTADVSGLLPVANGGTGTASPSLVQGTGVTITGSWPNQTVSAPGAAGTVTSVGLSAPAVFSVSGSPVTGSGTLALSYSGTALPVANGGTNSTTALSGSTIMVSNGTGIVQGAAGTTTTVLHGNASGAPTFAAVSLTADVSGTLPVGNGGTGITSLGSGVATWLGTPSSANLAAAMTDETGSGALVFATSPTLVTPVLGTPTSGTLSNCTVDGTTSVGFRTVPSNSQSTAYTTVLADSGKSIDHPASDANARTFTIDSNANVAYPIGTCITFTNMSANAVTIAITADTMYLAGSGSTGSRTLAQYGVATARKILSTTWLISGTGLT